MQWRWYDPFKGWVSGEVTSFHGVPWLINDKMDQSPEPDNRRIYFMTMGDDGGTGPAREGEHAAADIQHAVEHADEHPARDFARQVLIRRQKRFTRGEAAAPAHICKVFLAAAITSAATGGTTATAWISARLSSAAGRHPPGAATVTTTAAAA